MRDAIASAEVGDEQKREDPTVNLLEQRAAELLGQEEAVYLPTATMANEIALRLHGEPGDELLAEEYSHILISELGGPAVFTGLLSRPLVGEAGRISVEQIRAAANPILDVHTPRTRVVSIENTNNSAGGRVWPLEEIDAVVDCCRELDLKLHLDGARLFNASIALGVPPAAHLREGRHGDHLPLEGVGLPARRPHRRLDRAHGSRATPQAHVRRRDAAGGNRRGRRRLRVRAQHRPARRRPRTGEEARGGACRGRIAGDARRRGDELRPDRRRAAGPVEAGGARAGAPGGRGHLRNRPQEPAPCAVTHLDVDDDDIEQAIDLLPRALGTLAHA